jgi:TRAP-type C4-dicarboxylate transport system substrate-binding protein
MCSRCPIVYHFGANNMRLGKYETMLAFFLMRKDVFDKLSPEMQKAIEKAGVEAGEVAMQSGVELTAALLAELESKGVTLVEVDKDGLQAVAIPLQDQMAAELGMTQLLEDIRSLREEK